MRNTTPTQDFVRGIWRENPVLIQMLGLCPALAVTNTVKNALAMSAATFFVLTCSSVLIASVKRLIPKEVRISSYILVIATFVTLADMMLQAYAPVQHKELGAFIALIVVNCMILGRAEAFASRNSVGKAALDALGMGAGFTLACLSLGSVRELLGNGSLAGIPVFGPNFEPWIIMILPPGAFFVLGLWLLLFNWLRERREAQVE